MKPILDFSENLKLTGKTQRGKRIVSVRDDDWYRKEKAILKWSLRAVFFWGEEIVKARRRGTLVFAWRVSVEHREKGKTFVLYRTQMLSLLNFPKPAFDQLAIELPCFMGFRAQEVCTWKAEYIDFQHMNTFVLDAKKHRLFTVPLNIHVAKHVEEVLAGRSEGYVLRSRSNRNPNQQLTPTAIWYIWDKYTKLARLPNAKDISPVTGRRFFAAEWHYSQGLSLVTLQMILRHSHFETTMRYVRSLVFYEDLKRDYDKFQFRMMEEMQKKCIKTQL